MKNFILYILSMILVFSCSSPVKETQKEVALAAFPLDVPEANALMSAWEKKTVHQTRLIDDMEQPAGWQVTGIGEMSYITDRARDGGQSLRFRTSLRDEEHYRQNRSEWDSFNGTQGGRSFVELPFKEPQNWSDFNRISFWIYVHPADMPTYCIYLSFDCEGSIYNAAYPGKSHFVHDLKPGQWNHVMYEIHHLKRDKVTAFRINQMLTGHHPEEEGIVTYDIDQLEIQLVDGDQYEGWEVAPEKFAFNHAGYRPSEQKIAMVGEGAGGSFQLIGRDGNAVFNGEVQVVRNEQGMFRMLDFSGYEGTGEFRLRTGNLESNPFPIEDQVWVQPLFKAVNFFFCQRCGYAVPGIHLECHKDWQGFYGETKKIINGGWHDAGDLSQGSWRTAMSAYAMMLNLENLEQAGIQAELAGRIREEIAWGLQYLLKTRFGDGYHMSFSVMRIYTDNEVGTIDDVVSPARNIPWENFLTAAVQCQAAVMLKNSHPELAEQSRIASLEDWQAAVDSMNSRDRADYREAAWGATSSIQLSRMTGDEKYIDQAIRFGRLLIQCQEQRFVDGIPITGYFYTSTERNHVIHNHHAAFEEAPLIALTMLCREFPGHEDWMQWYSAAALHSEFFMKRGSRIAEPYGHLPNSVWKRSEILSVKEEDRRTDMMRQFEESTKLNEEYVLRTFPIYRDNLFHGNTNIQMSSAWALAEAARLRNDADGIGLVQKQMEWVLGANPFGQSLMYGLGYDFAPHFAYCLKNIVGSLPVGMDCLSGDQPYWSATNNATHKEIWVEPVNRFLGALSVYTSFAEPSAVAEKDEEEIQFRAGSERSGQEVTVLVTLNGKGKHEVLLRTFNAAADEDVKSADLSGNGPGEVQFKLKIIDPDMPYVVVIMLDNDPGLRTEVIGSAVDLTL
ncbi:MAG: glycoside hydrolase family 9 protein [Cyclobacteriaceae bacterium]|nr:glycoside hydrolase family 9 protein [Cyclobacteriaceae bacterium]